MSIGPLTAGDSGLIPVDYRGGPFQLSLMVAVASGQYRIDYTLDDLQNADWQITGRAQSAVITSANAIWLPHPTLTGMTVGNYAGNIAFPVTGIRLVAVANGSAYARMLQTPVVGG
jgi:hypothetical protein